MTYWLCWGLKSIREPAFPDIPAPLGECCIPLAAVVEVLIAFLTLCLFTDVAMIFYLLYYWFLKLSREGILLRGIFPLVELLLRIPKFVDLFTFIFELLWNLLIIWPSPAPAAPIRFSFYWEESLCWSGWLLFEVEKAPMDLLFEWENGRSKVEEEAPTGWWL